MRLLLLILLPLFSFGQLNIKAFGARESYADNSRYIQRALDSAIKSGKSVIIPKGRWKIAKPLIAVNWNGVDYGQVFFVMKGESTYWDRGNQSVIEATFGDTFILGIQEGKGCVIEGVTFQGMWKRPYSPYGTDLETYKDSTTRDSRWSPYSAIVIDPFCYYVPPDGGYPGLTSYYRGGNSNGGSTGITVKNCSFTGFTIGAITSPNGYTQNAELITFENIRIADCKIGFAGCQAQEKMNRVINVGAWGTTHTLFCFNFYGQSTPGNWIIDGVNIAGEVNQIISRGSGGYFPMFMSNVYAESIFQVGYWDSYVGDALSNFVIDFLYPEQLGFLPNFYLSGGGVTLRDGVMRVYGTDLPIVFRAGRKDENSAYVLRDVKSTESVSKPSVFIQGYKHSPPDGVDMWTDCKFLELKNGQLVGGGSGKMVLFMSSDFTLLGYGLLNGDSITYKSVGIQDGFYYTYIK